MKAFNIANLSAITGKNKGLGCPQQFLDKGWNVTKQHISLPCACLYETRLDNNIAWMADFATQSNVKFSPHGKTTMTPAIFKKQLAAGAYALTVATVQQAEIALKAGAKKILMANQLIGMANFNQLKALLLATDVEFFCLVDNTDNITALGEYFAQHNISLNVLIELGIPGGRCGIVDDNQLTTLVDHISQYSALTLAGIELYEGVLSDEKAVSQFLEYAVAKCNQLVASQAFDTDEVIITAGGSAWYDLVCQAFQPEKLAKGVVPVIRPGCYVAHDEGIYEEAQQAVVARTPLACSLGSDLQSCLEIWAYVQSIPEAGRAIISMGKRDVAFDAGLPTANLHVDQHGLITQAGSDWQVEKIMDQHAMLSFSQNASLKVGDIIAFTTSHPCLTFDKWRYINVIDDNYHVVDIYETYF